MKKHAAVSYSIGFLSASFTCWLGGFDFNLRGESAVWWFIFANLSGIFSTIAMLTIKDLS